MFLTLVTSTRSQTITDSTKREITYFRLGEFAKTIEYKRQIDSIVIPSYRNELRLADSTVAILQGDVNKYLLKIVPAYNERIRIKDSLLLLEMEQNKEQKYQIKELKGKWLRGFSVGALLGILAAALFGIAF